MRPMHSGESMEHVGGAVAGGDDVVEVASGDLGGPHVPIRDRRVFAPSPVLRMKPYVTDGRWARNTGTVQYIGSLSGP